MDRRGLIAGGAAFAASSLLPARSRAAPREINFRLFRKGSHVGQHLIRLEQTDAGLTVSNEVEIVIKIAFITVYHYRQRASDLWVSDILTHCHARCNEDGLKTEFEAERVKDELVFQAHEGEGALPIGTMTDLCFWHQGSVSQTQMVSTQFGHVAQIFADPPRIERVLVQGALREAVRNDLVTDIEKSGTIWYDRLTGAWIKGSLKSKGETIDYELDA